MREMCIKIQRWYRESNGHRSTLNIEGLEHTSTLRYDLYRQPPQEGEPIPILVQLVSIADGPPEIEDITFAVRKLLIGRSGGLLGIKVEHLKT